MSLLNKIEEAGDWRREELTRFELLMPDEGDANFSTICRGAIVLAYAHWEGYFNEATDLLFAEISASSFDLRRSALAVHCLVMRPEIDKLVARNAKDDAIIEFLFTLQGKSYAGSTYKMDSKIVKSRSNLDWERLKVIFSVYGVSWIEFERERIFIQHQLAGLRHAIAHGTDPTLKRDQVRRHLELSKQVLNEIPPFFQQVHQTLCC